MSESSTLRGPPAGLLGRGRDEPAGEDIERFRGIRAIPQFGCRAARLHPPPAKQTCVPTRENPYMRKDRWSFQAKIFLSYCFILDFFSLSFSETYFSKEISPGGDRLAIQQGASAAALTTVFSRPDARIRPSAPRVEH